jgi:asparagine synthase (glutamine-hydrolysing)
MSAIAGIFYFDGNTDSRPAVSCLVKAMSHRGPDGNSLWVKNNVGFGHCLLRSTPESFYESLPHADISSSLTITADARIDNRDDLLTKLGLNKREKMRLGDSELILETYKKWGKDCASHLMGDFAFAIWDQRQKILYCARDQLGAKSLAFVCNKRFFAFASEGEALLTLPCISSKPNEELVAHFLLPAFQDFNPRKSWLSEIDGLNAGEYLVMTPEGKPAVHEYWQLGPPQQEDSYVSELESLEAFLEIFSEAVRCRLRTAGDPAAMISGGMDSASIRAMIGRLLPEKPGKSLHTYSAIADSPDSCVESQCILSLTDELGDRAHFVSVPSFKGIITLEDVIDAAWSKPHPVDNSLLLPAMMCLAASRHNHRSLFHGASGDLTTDTPLRYIAYFLRQGHLLRAWKECRLASRNHTYMHIPGPFKILALNAWSAWSTPSLKLLRSIIRRHKSRFPLEDSIVSPEFAYKINLVERLRDQQLWATKRPESEKYSHLANGIVSGLTGFGRIAGRYGVDLRDPWADRRVLNFFQRLPMEYKIKNGWTKYIVRTAFASDLDKKVRWRRGKEHLGYYFACRVMESSHEFACSRLQGDLGALEPYINKKVLEHKLKRYQSGNDNSSTMFLYDILTLLLWMERRY